MKDFRRVTTHNVSPHPTFGPIYWARVDIVEASSPKYVVKTIQVDSRASELAAVESAIAAADAWIAAHQEEDEIGDQNWREIAKDDVLTAVCQCSYDLKGNSASWECIADKLGISFPRHVYSLCEELEEQGVVVRAARFIVLTELGLVYCKARSAATEKASATEAPVEGQVWDL